MIGSVDELRRYLNTGGGGGSSSADNDLLASLLAAADARFKEAAPDRTLEPLPALRDAGENADPRWVDDGDPVALSFPSSRVVQVPDLREVVSITDAAGAAYGGTYTLRGRHGKPAWWVRFDAPVGVPIGTVVDDPLLAAGDRPAATVVITGRWGPPDVEPHVREAVLIWASRVYHQRAARYADARQDPDGGVASYFRAIPADIRGVIETLRVPGL